MRYRQKKQQRSTTTAIRRAMQNLKPLFDSPARIVISHGNGPQIGSLLIQQAKSNSDTTPAMPLDTCGAMSQGMIGYWLEKLKSIAF